MALRPDLLQAFSLLGVDSSSDFSSAAKAYKRQALLHHPDRNHGDSDATRRFQEIGAAWNICQRHFDNPTWGYSQFSADDDIPLDDDDVEFYVFVFAETLFGRYSRAKGQRFRYQRSGRAGGGLATFSGGLAESQARQARNTERQTKENEEYEKRKRELELEIEQEEREQAEKEERSKADVDRREHALEHAFRAASSGDSAAVKKAILDYDLDVNTPRKRSKHSRKAAITLSDSLLHVAANNCDGDLFMFLLERGADPIALNGNQLSPFHSAVKAGNARVVQFILEHRGRSLDSYHPSKATASGQTPLQLAIESRVPSVVELLVKYATTHDVDRCWKIETISEDIKQILLKKKGFVPPNDSTQNSKPSFINKSRRKQELDEQKQARIAEELERAAINRQKREDRAARFLEKERADAAAKLVQARRKAELEGLDRIEHERAAREACKKRLEENGREAQADHPAVASGSKVAKQENRSLTQTEEKRPSLNFSVADNVNSSLKSMSQASLSSQTIPTLAAHVKDENVFPSIRPSEVQRTNIRHAKSKEKRQTKLDEKEQRNIENPILDNRELQSRSAETQPEPLRAVDNSTESLEEGRKRKEEAVLRRRAEQSARDKERHRRKLEEQAREKRERSNTQGETSEYIPLTPVSTHTTVPERKRRKEVTSQSTVPSAPNLFRSREEFLEPREEIQTCIVPEDLFKDEPPVARRIVDEGGTMHSRVTEEGRKYKRRGYRRPRA